MSDESLFREVDEEIRQDQFKKLWDRYGSAVIGLCLVVVLGVAGMKGWQYWQVKQSQAAAESFFAATRLADENKVDDALKQLRSVNHPGFGLFARLQEAGLLAAQGKAEEAVKIYDSVAADTGADSTLRDLARIRAAYVLAETLKPGDLAARVATFDKPGNPWRHAAREIIGIAAWRVADYGLADKTMSAILADPETPPALRARAQTISELIVPLLAARK